LREPVCAIVEDGFVTQISGGAQARVLSQNLAE
jgi:hypothetical protein